MQQLRGSKLKILDFKVMAAFENKRSPRHCSLEGIESIGSTRTRSRPHVMSAKQQLQVVLGLCGWTLREVTRVVK